jgi:hypothetical protein
VRAHVKTDGYNILLREKIISISIYLPRKPTHSNVTRLCSIHECEVFLSIRKVHHRTGMTAHMGSGCIAQRHAPTALPTGKTRYPLYRRLGGPPEPVWAGAENLASTGIRSPDRATRSEWLYRLLCVTVTLN